MDGRVGALRRRNRWRGLLVAVAIVAGGLLIASPPGVTFAQSDGDLEQAEAALEHATAAEREAAEKYAEAVAALPAAEARLAEAEVAVDEAEAAMAAADEVQQAADDELAQAAGRHERLDTDRAAAEDRVGELAATAYMGRTSRMFTISALLRASGPADAVSRLSMVNQISAHEREVLGELTDAVAAAAQARDEADEAYRHAEDTKQAARDALSDARAAKRTAEEAAAEVEALVDAQSEALAVAEEERERAEAELARIEEELRAWEEANRDSAPELASGTTLRMPVAGVLTSGYGWRSDPITGEQRLHGGMDFAAPGGTPIWAAASGTVIQAGWNGGYGLFTCVSHGTHEARGLSTCYAHQSEILVSPGQAVAAGETIGRVGTTGHSTGDHLHFEVRLDGTPTDPRPWLPECLC